METLLLSKQETARMLCISLRSLEHLISRGEIRPVCGIGRRVLIPRSALDSFIKAHSSDEHDARPLHKAADVGHQLSQETVAT